MPLHSRNADCRGSSVSGTLAMEPGPFTGQVKIKAALRASKPQLPEGRLTLEVTTKLCEKYWRSFLLWTEVEGIDMSGLLKSYLF